MKRNCSILLIPLVFLAACEGEPGFTGEGTPPPGAGAFAIDSANAVAVTGTAYQAALASGELAGLTESTGLTADAGGVNKTSVLGKAGGLVNQNVPIGPETQPCAVFGEVIFSADVVDPFAVFDFALFDPLGQVGGGGAEQ